MFHVLPILVYNKRHHPGLDFNQLQDLAGMRIGTLIGDDYIRGICESAGLRIETVKSVEANMKKLYAGRIDLADSTFLTAAYLRKSLFPDGKEFLGIIPKPIIPPVVCGLMYFKRPGTERQAHSFAQGMQAIRLNGTYERILKNYYGLVPEQVYINPGSD